MIDDPIQSATPAESRLDLDRVEYRLKDGLDRLDLYYNLVPVTATGQPCGDATRKHLVVPLNAEIKNEVIDEIKVADALAVLRKLAKRQIKNKEQ
jgi:hypothetical protein